MLTAAIVVAGGTGSRLGLSGGKQLALLLGVPVLSWALLALDAVDDIGHIVVVCPAERLEEYRATAVGLLGLSAPVTFAASGETRQASVASGLDAVPAGFALVAVHDGARPLLEPATVDRALEVLASTPEADGIVIGHPAVDTMKVVRDGWIESTPERSNLWVAQTPQIFRTEVFRDALLHAEKIGFLGTDDSAVVEYAGGRVLVCEGSRDNIKVTVTEDIALAEAALSRRRGAV
jgi:2-C-methyl-D-erythritol 4-phosphate cytidylyltransferase